MKKFDENSPIYQEMRQALAIIGDKWSVLILMCILDSPKRFNEIQSQIGEITPRSLTLKLTSLEQAGMIAKKSYNEFPPRTEYTVTQKAKDLKQAISQLKDWAKKYNKKTS